MNNLFSAFPGNRLIKQVSVLLVTASMASACTSPSASTGSNESGKNEKPVEISIITEFHTAEPPAPDNSVTKEFEKRTNTKLNITWVSPNNWTDKQNVVLASGDIPDLMKISDLRNPQMQQMVTQGAFWDLTPFIKDYKNLMEYPKETWEKTKINGKNYVIPSVRPLDGGGFPAIRKDWLDKLGLKMPETMDELYQALKAFAENDPDGNGKKDTYGYNMRDANWAYDVFNKSNGKWKLENGKIVDTVLQPGTREAILWYQRLYKEGLIPEDYSVLKSTQMEDMAKAGKVGMTLDTVAGVFRSTQEAKKLDPKADYLPFNSLTGPQGKAASQSPGFGGVYLIPKKVTEAKVKQILALMDYGASEEGFELACFGIKDVHFKVEDGFKIATEQAAKDSVSQSSFGKIFERFDKYLNAYNQGMSKDIFERNKLIIDERAKISIADPTIGLISETDMKMGSEYIKKTDDMKVKVIMGKEPIESWDKMVEQLKVDPQYQKIAEEFNKSYQERSGK